MYDFDNIIQRIKALAKQQGITQTFLCKQIGKRATFLNEVKLGKDKIRDGEIASIASILGTTPEYLCGETDDLAPIHKKEKSPTSPALQELIEEIYSMSDDDAAALLALIRQMKGGR